MRIGETDVLPRFYDDPDDAARMGDIVLNIFVRELFRRLPGFLDWYVDERLVGKDGLRPNLSVLRSGAETVAENYLNAVEQRAAVFFKRPPPPDACSADGKYRLERVSPDRLEIVLIK